MLKHLWSSFSGYSSPCSHGSLGFSWLIHGRWSFIPPHLKGKEGLTFIIELEELQFEISFTKHPRPRSVGEGVSIWGGRPPYYWLVMARGRSENYNLPFVMNISPTSPTLLNKPNNNNYKVLLITPIRHGRSGVRGSWTGEVFFSGRICQEKAKLKECVDTPSVKKNQYLE